MHHNGDYMKLSQNSIKNDFLAKYVWCCGYKKANENLNSVKPKKKI
jgi:hypothetical protein